METLTESAQNDRAKDTCYAKRTWETAEAATGAAVYVAHAHGNGGERAQAYRCRHCGKWHLARYVGETS